MHACTPCIPLRIIRVTVRECMGTSSPRRTCLLLRNRMTSEDGKTSVSNDQSTDVCNREIYLWSMRSRWTLIGILCPQRPTRHRIRHNCDSRFSSMPSICKTSFNVSDWWMVRDQSAKKSISEKLLIGNIWSDIYRYSEATRWFL